MHERLETLDGTPREILRVNEQVTCYIPETMTMKVERVLDTRPFPGMRADPRVLAEHYTIRKGGSERIAGYDCQSIVLEPKDNLRYGHKLWADVATGMLVKAKTFEREGRGGRAVRLHPAPGRRPDRPGPGEIALRGQGPRLAGRVERNGRAADLERSRLAPQIASRPGYRKVTEMKRNVGASADVGHIVVSDGLAAVSVFIETLGGEGVRGPARPLPAGRGQHLHPEARRATS